MGRPGRILLLRALVLLGLVATVFYFSWWVDAQRAGSFVLVLALLLVVPYFVVQLLGSWCVFLAARRIPDPPALGAADHLTVDVWVTSCGEPYEMVARTLGAAVAIRGRHRTWLLDDGDDPVLAALAHRLGAGYLTRSGCSDRKAGNLNSALARTDGDIVVILDADHVPEPEFLETTLGHFSQPAVGFVQVMVSYSNDCESWFARAANESLLDFFNPTSIGMHRLGSPTMHGSNALIRRKALESIGGYRPGLAEDLATSIALHAAGWTSAYVARPLAPGQAPPDVGAWFKQQLKWSRGVFEVLLSEYPRAFVDLSWGQRLCYGVRTTYYWVGPFAALHMLCTVGALIASKPPMLVDIQGYMSHLMPLVIVTVAIRMAALWCWRHPSVRTIGTFRAWMLIHTTWPVYTLAWTMAVLRRPLRFIATPKRYSRALPWRFLAPSAAVVLLLTLVSILKAASGEAGPLKVLLAVAALQALPQIVVIWMACGHAWRQTSPVGQGLPATGINTS